MYFDWTLKWKLSLPCLHLTLICHSCLFFALHFDSRLFVWQKVPWERVQQRTCSVRKRGIVRFLLLVATTRGYHRWPFDRSTKNGRRSVSQTFVKKENNLPSFVTKSCEASHERVSRMSDSSNFSSNSMSDWLLEVFDSINKLCRNLHKLKTYQWSYLSNLPFSSQAPLHWVLIGERIVHLSSNRKQELTAASTARSRVRQPGHWYLAISYQTFLAAGEKSCGWASSVPRSTFNVLCCWIPSFLTIATFCASDISQRCENSGQVNNFCLCVVNAGLAVLK